MDHPNPNNPIATIISDSDVVAGYSGDFEAKLHYDVLNQEKHLSMFEREEILKVINERIFRDLRIDPTEHPLMTNKPFGVGTSRDFRIMGHYFEYYDIPALSIIYDGILAMNASAKTSGMSVMVGENQTEIFPVYQGYALTQAIVTTKTSGSFVSKYLSNLLRRRGIIIPDSLMFNNQLDQGCFGVRVIDDIKHKLCECLGERLTKLVSSEKSNKKYQLPCGSIIEIGPERHLSTEVLFDTRLDVESDVSEHLSIPDAITRSISLCEIDIRIPVLKNLVVCGGNSMMEGLKPRLKKEVEWRVSKSSLWLKSQKQNKNSLLSSLPASLVSKIQDGLPYSPRIIGRDAQESIWIGGSILSSLSTFQQLWISREEFGEVGPKALLYGINK